MEGIFNKGLRKGLRKLPASSVPLAYITPVLFLHRIAESVSPPNLYTSCTSLSWSYSADVEIWATHFCINEGCDGEARFWIFNH